MFASIMKGSNPTIEFTNFTNFRQLPCKNKPNLNN